MEAARVRGRDPIHRESVPLTLDALRRYGAVVLVTDHTAFPYPMIHESASLIVDSRNAFPARGLAAQHVVSA